MEIKIFEETLLKMTKPEVPKLKHQDLLIKVLDKAKKRSVLSWWWISAPLYVIAALLMKSYFMPHTSLVSNLQDLALNNRYASPLLFLFLPVFLIFFNSLSIRNVYTLSGNPKITDLFLKMWFNSSIIIVSILSIIIYLI